MPRKTDHNRLQELLDQGLNQVEIAKELGVAKSSVCKAIKRHRLTIAKVATTTEAVPAIIERKIEILKQIKSINDTTFRELDWIKKTIKGTMDDRDRIKLQDQMIKLSAEVRKQMGTVLDVAKTLYNAEEAQAFMRIVLQAIDDADPATKEKIITKLQET